MCYYVYLYQTPPILLPNIQNIYTAETTRTDYLISWYVEGVKCQSCAAKQAVQTKYETHNNAS